MHYASRTGKWHGRLLSHTMTTDIEDNFTKGCRRFATATYATKFWAYTPAGGVGLVWAMPPPLTPPTGGGEVQ